MKKIMKKVCCVIIPALVIAITIAMTVTAYAEPTKIANSYDLRRVIEMGGEGIFTQDIEDHYMPAIRMREGLNASIDLNGYSFIMTCSGSFELKGNVCLYNGEKIKIFLNSNGKVEGSLAIKDTRTYITTPTYLRLNLLLVDSPDYSYEKLYTPPVIVSDTKKAMTDEQFVEMVKTGKLPQLEKEGYMFAEWRDQSDNVITEWKAEGVKEIKPVWERDIQITFDTNGGTCDAESVRPLENGKLETIPAAKKDGVCFDGWITQSGDKVTADTVFTEPTTLKASWVEESSRAEALAECMDEQGFSQKSIDRHTGMLSNGITASFFGMGNIWMIIAIIFIIISVVLFAVIRKKSNESEDV